MKITKAAVAGTLESSDAQVRIQPFDSLDIEINSSVAKQFGEQIEATVRRSVNQIKHHCGPSDSGRQRRIRLRVTGARKSRRITCER